jgi:L-asparaginase/Glu-tRNA(Gln) amidotransferase subunit D
MKKRIVITGMGVAAPNAHGLDKFEKALRNGVPVFASSPVTGIEFRLPDSRRPRIFR